MWAGGMRGDVAGVGAVAAVRGMADGISSFSGVRKWDSVFQEKAESFLKAKEYWSWVWN